MLSTTGEIIIASKRIRFSWFNAGWMLAALLFTCAWWIGLWDLRALKSWGIGTIGFYFSMAAGIYLQARLVSPHIPERGEIDLQRFHTEEGRKYLIAYTVLCVATVLVNATQGEPGSHWPVQNLAVIPATLAAAAAAIFIRNAWAQSLALVVHLGAWVWYFAALQGALSE